MKLYVCNLNYALEEKELQEVFEKYGIVTSVTIIKDKMSGRSKGFGFIDMPNKNEALQAINELNETQVQDRKILVSESKPRKDKPSFNQRRR